MKIGKYTFELKNFAHFEPRSEETNCFSADLYVDGKMFATCGNDGHGGDNEIRVHQSLRKFESEIEEHLMAQPPFKYKEYELPMCLDLVIDILVEESLKNQEAKRRQAMFEKSLIFKGRDGSTYSMSWKKLNIEDMLSVRAGVKHLIDAIEEAQAQGAELLNTNVSLEKLKEQWEQ